MMSRTGSIIGWGRGCPYSDPDDGCCTHERNATPECHEFACPFVSADDIRIRDRCYHAAGLLVHRIDTRLERGEHFRDRHGGLLLSLDQVIEAVLHDNLATKPARE